MPINSRDAVTILRRRFPSLVPQPPPADAPYDVADDPPGVDDLGTGALELSRLRDQQSSELADRLANQESAAALGPREGYVQGEPGRRALTNVAAANAIGTRRNLQSLAGEIAADPYTGTAEQDRLEGIRGALDKATMTQSPEFANAADTIAKQNAFAKYMQSKGMAMGEYEAAGSPAARAAAETPLLAQVSPAGEQLANEKLEREQKLRMSPQLVAGQMPTGQGDESGGISGFTAPPNMKPLGVESERAMVAMRQNAPLLGRLQSLLDPARPEPANKAANMARWASYKLGITDTPFLSSDDPVENARNQARMQLASMITIIGSTPFMQGSRNYQRIKDIEKHLTNPNASDKFLYNQVQELRDLLPVMQKELMQAHVDPSVPLNFDSLIGRGVGGGSEPFSIKAPNGQTYTFPDQASLDAFKQSARIR